MTELHYDGPDLEADTSGRVQGLLMATVMAGEGVHNGHAANQHRREQRHHDTATREEQADRALWSGVPARDWAELDDAALAVRWQAAARHSGHRDADTARGAIERELTARDPDTMRDYRAWRYAAGADPGTAMQQALHEREQRLAAAWRPLADGRADQLDETQIAAGWVAALGSHATDAQPAAATGEQLLRDRLPGLIADYDTARAELPLTPDGQRTPGLVSGYAAAASATGHRLAFGPGTAWTDTLQHGTPRPAISPVRPAASQVSATPSAASRVLAAHATRALHR